MGKTLRGYLFREIAMRFMGSLALFTFILLSARVIEMVDLVLLRGVDASQLARLFALILPALFETTAPVAALMAVLVTFTRLAADGELTAMRAAGLSWNAYVRPVARFGFVVLAAAIVTALFIRPATDRAVNESVFALAKSRATTALQSRVFFSDFTGVVVYADDVDPESGTLRGILVADERKPTTPTAIFAAFGSILPDQTNGLLRIQLRDGSSLMGHGETASYDLTSFSTLDVNLDVATPWDKLRDRATPSQMSPGQLWSAASQAGESQLEASIEMHRRGVFATATFIFAILGMPIGASRSRSGRGRGLALSLVVALLYYLALSAAITIVRRGGLPAYIGIWLPNAAFVAFAALLLLNLERGSAHLVPEWVHTKLRRPPDGEK